ncbi:hypothetical protein FLAN108750_11680 [Flavobacterium antarcticum]|uniref:hypothetical protein n=1 Tax=Flavobacterium antarcticum TaxID=271155 RepID=UPI0003B40DD8|nr:hypothetical protein [Flavobacterium antarcticum]
MELTYEQISQLEDYVAKSNVMFYEVYLEILDHMILKTEEMLLDETVSFEQAFQILTEKDFSKKEIIKISRNSSKICNNRMFANFKNHLRVQTKPFYLGLNLLIFIFIFLSKNALDGTLLMLIAIGIISIIDIPFFYTNYYKKKLVVLNTHNLMFYYGVVPLIFIASIAVLNTFLSESNLFSLIYTNLILPSFFVMLFIGFTFNLKQRKKSFSEAKQYVY